MLTDEQKKFYKEIAIAAGILLFLAVFVWLSLGNAQEVSFNTRKLADVEMLRSELEHYYYKHNQYPVDIAGLAEGLPLNFSPQSYAYAACSRDHGNCEEPDRRESYRLGYDLQDAAGLPEGRQTATPGEIMNRF